MVNAGRATCLALPFILSTAALACLVLVFLGGFSEHNNTLGGLYFLKTDLTNFTTANLANLVPGLDATESSALAGALSAAKNSGGLADYYTIYLENYCSWNGKDAYSYCSPREANFAFDPIAIWGLNSTSVEPLLPASLRDGVATYKKLAGVMYVFYVIALSGTALVLLFGITALFSKWGSFFTTAVATLAGLSAIVASTIATVLFAALDEAVNHTALGEDLGIKASLGQPILRITWLSVLFAGGAWIFWFLSICCCSTRSPYKSHRDADRKRVKVEKTPYTYERVGSPYLGPRDGQNVPLQTFGGSPQPQYHQQQSAYEPFRPQQV